MDFAISDITVLLDLTCQTQPMESSEISVQLEDTVISDLMPLRIALLVHLT